MSTPTKSSAERRRRITERGADRMALITGRVHSLHIPSSPSTPPSPVHQRSVSVGESPSPLSITDHQLKVALEGRIDARTVPKDETSDAARRVTSNDQNLVHHRPSKSETSEEARRSLLADWRSPITDRRSPLGDSKVMERPPSVPRMHHRKTAAIDPHLRSRSFKAFPFSSKQITSSITATEGTRMYYAFLIASVVVLSHLSYWLSGFVTALRPLFILLITDLIIVLLRLQIFKPKGYEEAGEETEGPQVSGQNLDGALTVMERGLVAYQVIRAMFIDFSIYTVIVACGLSLV